MIFGKSVWSYIWIGDATGNYIIYLQLRYLSTVNFIFGQIGLGCKIFGQTDEMNQAMNFILPRVTFSCGRNGMNQAMNFSHAYHIIGPCFTLGRPIFLGLECRCVVSRILSCPGPLVKYLVSVVCLPP